MRGKNSQNDLLTVLSEARFAEQYTPHYSLHAERKPAFELFSKPFVEPESVSSVRKIS
jgi:hypothetical protein